MIIRDDPSRLLLGARSAILINPPIYDTQYWPHWSQPHGLLKVATWLRAQGYTQRRLLDCLATDERRRVSLRRRGVVQRGGVSRQVYEFGWPLQKLRLELERHAKGELFRPDEVWITSTMTCWWESTRDVIRLVREVFDSPQPRIYVGGIYPTLCPEHAEAHLATESDGVVIVPGEICEDAASAWTDLSLYEDEVYGVKPSYALITGSRGCPFNCAYCAQLILNDGNRSIRHRDPEDIADEVAAKHRDHRVREIAFYEDNLLFNREEFMLRLDAIERRGLKMRYYAPEGVEPRLISRELLARMRRLGFAKIYLALETIDDDISRGWSRRHATIERFDEAVRIAQECGYRVGGQDLNAFVLFGLPGEDLQAVVNTALYASHRVGSVVPMLFTPVPGSALFDQHRAYLLEEMGWDLHQLNGKLLPFLEYNQRYYPELRASDYLELEAFMMHLNNSKVYQKRFDLLGEHRVARGFRQTVLSLD
mgnify:CR=1 FL=1